MEPWPRVQPVQPAGLYDLPGAFDAFDKLDGWHLLLARGRASLRSGRDVWDQLPCAIRDRVGRMNGLHVHGELVLAGRPASRIARALADRDPALEFRPFHVPDHAGDPRSEHALLCALGWRPPAYLGRYTGGQLAEHWPTWARTLAEGVVLRPARGGRPWYKLKIVHSLDLPVVAVRPGRGRLADTVGALVCRLPGGREIQVGTGLTDDDRRRIGPHDVGRICEVAYQSRTARGSIQHARFVRWRDDLDI